MEKVTECYGIPRCSHIGAVRSGIALKLNEPDEVCFCCYNPNSGEKNIMFVKKLGRQELADIYAKIGRDTGQLKEGDYILLSLKGIFDHEKYSDAMFDVLKERIEGVAKLTVQPKRCSQ